MTIIDVTAIEATARKEIAEEITKTAVVRLKELYSKREKALLVLRNIEKEITAYKTDILENAVYESAGVDTKA